jgi:hypothetical protein
MPSNNELRAQISALAIELEIEDVQTDGLKNDELGKLLADLEAKKGEAPGPVVALPPPVLPVIDASSSVVDGASDGSVGGPPVPAKPVFEQRFPWQIAAGKSLTTTRGVIGEGEEIKPSDVHGGADQLDALSAKGYITKAALAKS